MAAWIYNNKILRSHPIAGSYLSTLNEVSNQDYPGTNYFDPGIECLDLDNYEQNRKGESGNTVDAVIGISDCSNKLISNPRLLCVELRMRYKSTHNFNSDFANKVTHSKELLGGTVTIESKSLFIFSDALAPKAKSWIKNKQRQGIYKKMDSCGISEFHNIIKAIEEMPYQPINDETKIRTKLASYEENKDWSSYMKEFHNLCQETNKYCYSNPYEYDYLVHLLKSIWNHFRSQHITFENSDIELFAEIIEEDFYFLGV